MWLQLSFNAEYILGLTKFGDLKSNNQEILVYSYFVWKTLSSKQLRNLNVNEPYAY